jgi:hypothetical protein
MMKNTLIIFILVCVFVYYCYKNNLLEPFTGNKPRLKQGVGIRGRDIEKTIEVHHGSALEIGTDENDNKIFQFKGKMFKMNENNVLEVNEPKKINYKTIPVRLPITVTAKTIKSKFPLKYNEYKFTGLVSNEYYKQFFVLYEKEFIDLEMKEMVDKLYSYILVKNIDGQLKIIHNIPPRTRVKPGDNIYFSYGNLQLGPLVFV